MAKFELEITFKLTYLPIINVFILGCDICVSIICINHEQF